MWLIISNSFAGSPTLLCFNGWCMFHGDVMEEKYLGINAFSGSYVGVFRQVDAHYSIHLTMHTLEAL